MKTLTFLVLFVVILFAGCRSFQPNYSIFKSDHEKKMDGLWRAGYGYNNPNVERIRNGQEPLNFNGKPNTFKSSVEDAGEGIVQSALTFALFEGLPALYRGITSKLRR